MGAITAVMLFVSALLHELGHSVVARRYKIPVLPITLFILGGVSQIEAEAATAAPTSASRAPDRGAKRLTQGPRTAAGRCHLTGSSLSHPGRAWSRFETGKSAEPSPSHPHRPVAAGMHLCGLVQY
jgi:hypothetical protein